MARRYTTKQQDAILISQLLAYARKPWKVGDACLSYNLKEETTIARIEGQIVTLANGDQFHITRVRGIK